MDVQDTLDKFGFPDSTIFSSRFWEVLYRPKQVTLGSIVLVCKENVTAYDQISPDAVVEQGKLVKIIETVFKGRLGYEKINYLMLMMVDPHVHFHIFPRHGSAQKLQSREFLDRSWPGPCDLSSSLEMSDEEHSEMKAILVREFCNVADQHLLKKQFNRMYTTGCFDIFHHGHLNILRRTKELCHELIVGVSVDELILKDKGRSPIIPYEERAAIVEQISYVDKVVPQYDKNKQAAVDKFGIDAISVGSDWKGKYPKTSCEVIYFDYTPSVSSTILKEKLNLIRD